MSSRGSLSVLLVEDQAGSARLVQELLRNQAALQLTWVETLAAALAWVADHLVDTVLLDLGLPDSQGLDTATRVLRAYPTLPVIVLTGRADDAVALAALNAGAQDYLHKERLDADTLERTIRYAYERKRAEVALREREQQLALAIAGSGVGLWDWRVQTGEMVFSARWAEIGGYTVEELGACSVETWKALTHPEDLVKATALQRQHCADETPIYDCEIRLRHKAGHWVWVLDRGTVTERAADGTPLRMTGTRLDITDRKRLEEERLIRSKLESTGVLAGGIAHDFNNLLMVILGSLEALQDPAANQSALVAAASQATLEARALTQQFLTFAKGGQPARRPLGLDGVLRDAATLALRGASVECDLTLAADLWPVEGDPIQLGQVARNLILNAREAMPTGGRIVVRAENVPGPTPIVRVTIADLGPGIPAEILPKVFDPYFSTKAREGMRGTGLGLTVCRAIVEQHGGAITLLSREGEGTIVRVDLPAAPTAVLAAPSLPITPRPKTGRLLVMDDEEAVRITVGALLERLGYAVELTAHGAEAVGRFQAAQARGEPFAAVLLDLTVRGGIGGVPTLEALRRLDPTIKAIASSGYTDDPVLAEPARYGFRTALAKPYGVPELRERLAEVLGG